MAMKLHNSPGHGSRVDAINPARQALPRQGGYAPNYAQSTGGGGAQLMSLFTRQTATLSISRTAGRQPWANRPAAPVGTGNVLSASRILLTSRTPLSASPRLAIEGDTVSQVDVVSQVNVSPHPRKQGDISVGIINRRAELVRANQEKARKEFAEARRTCCNGRRLSG